MTDTQPPAPTAPDAPAGRVYEILTGNADASRAIDAVVAKATRHLRIFDHTLKDRGFNAPARFETLRQFLLHDRTAEIRIVLHDVDTVQRDCPRLMTLLRQFPVAVRINCTVGAAQQAHDPMVIADDAHFWHHLHYQHPRSVLTLDSAADAKGLVDRFEEIWESSEFGISATSLGL